MKAYLLPFVLLCSTIISAQEHNSDTSFVINKQAIRIQTTAIDSEYTVLKIYRNKKPILTDTLSSIGLSSLKFSDFDKDGNKDIILTYMGNNFTYDLYLFDKSKNIFRFVEGFERFPEAQQLKANPKYYYSYHRAGCADMNWVSDLFYISNFKSIHIGQIFGHGCDRDEGPYIKILKIVDNSEDDNNNVIVATLNYQKNIPEFGYKWEFIKKYWEKNYLKVVQAKVGNK